MSLYAVIYADSDTLHVTITIERDVYMYRPIGLLRKTLASQRHLRKNVAFSETVGYCNNCIRLFVSR